MFLVADIAEDNLILGYPFFESANLQIDWTKGTILGEVMDEQKKTTNGSSLVLNGKKEMNYGLEPLQFANHCGTTTS